jgi:WD40 repeat protein
MITIGVFVATLAASPRAAADDVKDVNPPSRTFEGHPRSVLSVTFSPDGKTLLSSARDSKIKVWDVATGQLKRTLSDPLAGGVYSTAYSRDGKLVASGSGDGKIILWDGATFEPIRTLAGHTVPVRDVAFAPDDKTLASASEDKTFRLWDVATGKPKVTRTEHTSQVKAVVYHPDGGTIVTASSDHTLRLWDGHTGEPKKVLKGHTNVIEFCAISPDGKQLMSGTGNIGELIFWNAQTGKIEKILPKAHGVGNDAEIDCGRYSPDGRWAVSGSKDRTDKFWDPKSFKLLHTISGNPSRTESMCFSPDGKTLATGFATDAQCPIILWDVSAWKE